MEEKEPGRKVLVLKVGIKLGNARKLKEALINNGSVRKADHREVVPRDGPQRIVNRQAEQVATGEPRFLAHPIRPLQECLSDDRHRANRGSVGIERARINRYVRPL